MTIWEKAGLIGMLLALTVLTTSILKDNDSKAIEACLVFAISGGIFFVSGKKDK